MYIALIFPLIPAVIGLFKWKHMNKAQHWFVILLWIIVGVSFSGELWLIMGGESNIPFFHIYILVECLVLIWIFKQMFNGKRTEVICWVLAIGFLLVWTINVFLGEGWWGFPDYIHALEALIILVLVLAWFMKMLREKIILRPEKTFEFWLCAGLLIFFSGNFLLFVFSEFLLTIEMSSYKAIWKVHVVLNLILYLIYTLALLWIKNTTGSKKDVHI